MTAATAWVLPDQSPRASLVRQRLRLGAAGLVVLVGLLALTVHAQRWDPRHPLLNEVVASNGSTLHDSHGETPDWIEVHNPTSEPFDLTGWYLSDNDDRPARWRLPELVLGPDQYLVIFASGEDRDDPDGELHTNFRLDRSGDPVLLVKSDGRTVADRFPAVELPRDASFGRDPQDPQRLCYFAFPRPGRANAPTCFDHADLGAPSLSASTGFYDEPFELKIGADGDTKVLFTLDGSYPDLADNADATRVYDGPLRIDDATGPGQLATIDTTITDPALAYFEQRPGPLDLDGVVIEQATVVRARTEHGAEASGTFFVGRDRVRLQLSVTALSVSPAEMFGEEGIYVPGSTFEQWRKGDRFNPDARAFTPANYQQRGRAWELPRSRESRGAVILDHCTPGGDCGIQREVGIRIHGRHSRQLPQKSLRLYARNDYGDRRFFEALLGPDGPVGHRRLLLRNSGNDNQRLMFTDGYLQSLMGDLDADTQAYEPTVLFINGEYWGIHNVRERYDRHYLEAIHGADPEAVEILDNTSERLETDTPRAEDDWNALLAGLADLDPTVDEVPAYLNAALDLDSFFDLVIAHTFVANRDWVSNNMRWWREPDGPDRAGQGPRDGRWRWLISDFDHMGGNAGRYDVEYDPLSERLAASDDPAHHDGFPFLFDRMMAHPQLRDRFVNRFADHLNTTFHPDRTLPRLEAASGRLADEMVHHLARWQSGSIEEWYADLAALTRFMQERPDIQRRQLADRLDLGAAVWLRVVHEPQRGTVTLNSLDLAADLPGGTPAGAFHGSYFPQVPVTLEAVPGDGFRFVRWQGIGTGNATASRIEVTLDGDLEIRAVFEREATRQPVGPSREPLGLLSLPEALAPAVIRRNTGSHGLPRTSS